MKDLEGFSMNSAFCTDYCYVAFNYYYTVHDILGPILIFPPLKSFAIKYFESDCRLRGGKRWENTCLEMSTLFPIAYRANLEGRIANIKEWF
jgi:hypothetical protein